MKLLTEDADLRCAHEMGKVAVAAGQNWVCIGERAVLIEPDPVARTISGCPNYGPTIKPCLTTLAVQRGYSDLVRIDGHRVCLESVEGLTDGTPPGTVLYNVHNSGQRLVEEGSS